jgi:hypothetical protein
MPGLVLGMVFAHRLRGSRAIPDDLLKLGE